MRVDGEEKLDCGFWGVVRFLGGGRVGAGGGRNRLWVLGGVVLEGSGVGGCGWRGILEARIACRGRYPGAVPPRPSEMGTVCFVFAPAGFLVCSAEKPGRRGEGEREIAMSGCASVCSSHG